MYIYLSYKQSGLEECLLKKELRKIKNILTKRGHKVFIWILDEPNRNKLSPDKIIRKTKEKIEKSDLILCYIKHKEKSEGMFLELGIGYTLNKKIKILLKNSLKNCLRGIYGLTKDIFFRNNEKEFWNFFEKI